MHQTIRAAIAGDESAWNSLYRQHYPWLYGMALRIWGNSPFAKDAVQETFLQAYLKLPQLKDPGAFASWLKTILIRYCNRQFTRINSSVHPDPSLFALRECWEDQINSKLDVQGRQTKIYDTINHLTVPLQSVLMLRYFSNWTSYDQIATILCIPAGTVRSRLNQAKQKMAEQWMQSSDDNDMAYLQALQWNHLYNNYFQSVHSSPSHREKLLQHFSKDLALIFTSGKKDFGRALIEKEINDDLVYGNHFSQVNVMSSGLLSIVEVQNTNSTEYPDRCPESSILVLYRNKNKVTKMHLHNSH